MIAARVHQLAHRVFGFAFPAAAAWCLWASACAGRRGDWQTCGPLAVCVLLLAAALVHLTALADTRLMLAARIERDARPPTPVDIDETTIRQSIALGWLQMDTVCCRLGWATSGHDHDPHTCTKKDAA